MTVAEPGAHEGLGKLDGCDLCEAARLTHRYHEDDVCWVAECEACDTPMVVWNWHGAEPPDDHRTHMLAVLDRIGGEVFAEHRIDGVMRQIPDHFHAHARPRGGFFGPRR